MRCPKCKTYNHDKAKFCINCGIQLNASNISSHTTINKKFIIIITVGVLFVLFGVIFFYKSAGNDREEQHQYGTVKSEQLSKTELKKKLEEPKLHKTASLPNSTDSKTSKQKYSENSRELLFKKALSVQYSNPLESLELISESMCIPPSISKDKITNNLKMDSITKVMLELIVNLSEDGYNKELLKILNPEVIINTGNIQVLLETAHIISKISGYGNAIQFVESVRYDLKFADISAEREVDSLTVQLYRQWLIQQIVDNNIDNAESIYNFAEKQYPSNPEILIIGIEIALKQGDWEKAEQLLNEINYPKSLSDKIELLKNQVSELKGQEGKIVIEFIPGSKHIPVQAVLNGKVMQNFLVDTGASFVTIPSSTVKALGVSISKNAPSLKVATAGGIKTAREIILRSITLGKCTVNNIKVLVLDIPGQPNLGLLGLNFLHYFHMEINNKKGILLLKPR